MIIKFNGTMSHEQLARHMAEIINHTLDKLEGVDDTKLRDVQVGVLFTVGGEDQYLTVKHDGLDEIYNVLVKLDENGEIERSKDNKEETFLDDYTRAVAKGEEFKVDPIESNYDNEELIKIAELDGGDLVETHYIFKDNCPSDVLVQYHREGVLVGEYSMLGVLDKAERDELLAKFATE